MDTIRTGSHRRIGTSLLPARRNGSGFVVAGASQTPSALDGTSSNSAGGGGPLRLALADLPPNHAEWSCSRSCRGKEPDTLEAIWAMWSSMANPEGPRADLPLSFD
jgi:hypothetical protein